MKRILFLFIILFGMQNCSFGANPPSWNDFAPSVIQKGDEAYWKSRYRDFEKELNNCKALPTKDRNKCFEKLSAEERQKNNNFFSNPSVITAKSTVKQTNCNNNYNYARVILPINYWYDEYWHEPYVNTQPYIHPEGLPPHYGD